MTMSNQLKLDALVESFKQQADEIRLQMHLEKKLAELKTKADVVRKEAGESSEDVLEAARLMAEEIKEGFNRIRKSL